MARTATKPQDLKRFEHLPANVCSRRKARRRACDFCGYRGRFWLWSTPAAQGTDLAGLDADDSIVVCVGCDHENAPI